MIGWESDFSQKSGFRRMLKGHKYFHSTPFSDKTNKYIFLTSPKAPFLGNFWIFLVIFAKSEFFKNNWAQSRTSPYGPLTPYKVSKNSNVPILRKLPERRTDGRNDGHQLIGTFEPGPGIQLRGREQGLIG